MKFIPVGVVLTVLLFFGQSARAATLYFDPPSPAVLRGDSVTLSVRLDTDEAVGECINVIDAVITYDETVLPVDFSLGQSIFRAWVEEPTINTDNRTITFAGGIPNGYCGRIAGDPRLTNTILEIVFRSPGLRVGDSGPTATVAFAPETTAYLNDGLGTKAPLTTYGATISLQDELGGRSDSWRDAVRTDTEPPEEFSITLTREERAFSGNYFIVFSTTDKQTGIDHYEVIEEPVENLGLFSWGGADAPWIITRSPYVLQDQTLNSAIRVKAVDKAGNEYIATIVPDEALRTPAFTVIVLYVLGAIGVALLVCVGYVLYQTIRSRRRAAAALTDDSYDTE